MQKRPPGFQKPQRLNSRNSSGSDGAITVLELARASPNLSTSASIVAIPRELWKKNAPSYTRHCVSFRSRVLSTAAAVKSASI